MPMHDPPHPGELVYHECIDYLEMSMAETAERLDMDNRQVTAIAEAREPITLNVARRLSLVIGSTTDAWLRMQDSYDNAPVPKKVRSVS